MDAGYHRNRKPHLSNIIYLKYESESKQTISEAYPSGSLISNESLFQRGKSQR